MDILAGNTALRLIARDLLTRIAEGDLDPFLRGAVRKIDEHPARQPESRGE